MIISLVKFLSYSIFIAEQQNNNILLILLKDYAKSRTTKIQFLLMLILVNSYKENSNLIKDDKYYRFLSLYIKLNANQICKSLIRS
jgi:hypothetical protein